MRAWLWRRLARVIERHYKCYLIGRGEWDAAIYFGENLHEFCRKSGFLRDGRYPGGRHAERKIRWRVNVLIGYLRNGVAAPAGLNE